jgi:(5-formylfuran-3-yl)methyl phosphate synthase
MSRPMHLLVSVANAAEARDAVDGGADLIDAKNPLNGALGAVSLSTLRQIHLAVSGKRVVSAALGDADDEATIERVASAYAATGVGFVKIGFAGITCAARVGRLITAAVRGVRATNSTRCGVVAVAYADTGGTTSVDPMALIDPAARAGASGVLLDTAHKEGPGLLQLVRPQTLTAWVAKGHDRGLTMALAGKVTADDLPFICDLGADVVGVRGAACAMGRSSVVVEDKIRALKSSLLSPRDLTHH